MIATIAVHSEMASTSRESAPGYRCARRLIGASLLTVRATRGGAERRFRRPGTPAKPVDACRFESQDRSRTNVRGPRRSFLRIGAES